MKTVAREEGAGNRWPALAAVFCVVTTVQLALVAAAGTDVPFHDQWNIEGAWLYPSWQEGSLRAADLFQPFNEHRILWTHLLNLGLFAGNGGRDPLVQMTAIAVLRAACAAGLVWVAWPIFSGWRRGVLAGVVALAFLPHLAWHNALWGIESHAYFSLGLSVLALALLGVEKRGVRRTVAGVAVAVAGFFAMGPGALVPVALLGLCGLRGLERRRVDGGLVREAAMAVGLLAFGLWLRAEVPEHADLQASGLMQFGAAVAQTLSWPHVNVPWAALVLNLPLLLVAGGRIARRRSAARGEDLVLLLGGWSLAICLGTAWARGGSAELAAGVPSRYVDFVVVLPLANLGCLAILLREASTRVRASARILSAAWAIFLTLGWLGLGAEMMRGVVLPRARNREAPVRLAVAFQTSGDPAVFDGQPRLLVPHPNLDVVKAVLADPRMRGKLPPSFQPEEPRGLFSRAVRWVLGRGDEDGASGVE